MLLWSFPDLLTWDMSNYDGGGNRPRFEGVLGAISMWENSTPPTPARGLDASGAGQVLKFPDAYTAGLYEANYSGKRLGLEGDTMAGKKFELSLKTL